MQRYICVCSPLLIIAHLCNKCQYNVLVLSLGHATVGKVNNCREDDDDKDYHRDESLLVGVFMHHYLFSMTLLLDFVKTPWDLTKKTAFFAGRTKFFQ